MLTFAPCSGKALSSIPSRILLPTPCLSSSSLILPSCPVAGAVNGGCLLCMMFPSAECVNASCSIGSSGSTSPSGACVAPIAGHHRKISWLPERQRYTTTLSVWVESLVRLLPIKHVAQLTGLHWHTVKNIDYRRLLRERTEPQRHTLRRLVMDEFALFKGHRYATVVMDADTQQVLWVGEGRSRAAFRPFFVWLGAEGCAAIQSVAMDMNTALDRRSGITARRRKWSMTCSMWWQSMAGRLSTGSASTSQSTP